jgi:hypothetical protein
MTGRESLLAPLRACEQVWSRERDFGDVPRRSNPCQGSVRATAARARCMVAMPSRIVQVSDDIDAARRDAVSERAANRAFGSWGDRTPDTRPPRKRSVRPLA